MQTLPFTTLHVQHLVTNLADLIDATSSTALFRGYLHARVSTRTLACREPLNKAVLDVALTKSARSGTTQKSKGNGWNQQATGSLQSADPG